MSSIEQLAWKIINFYGADKVTDLTDTAGPFTKENAIKLFCDAGASEELALYLSGCVSLGICTIMATLEPQLNQRKLPGNPESN